MYIAYTYPSNTKPSTCILAVINKKAVLINTVSIFLKIDLY